MTPQHSHLHSSPHTHPAARSHATTRSRRAQQGPHETSRRVDIGAVETSRHPLRLHTILGSCVSVCLWDPVARVGGMNHILVPSAATDCRCGSRCGVHAMELLINAVMQQGGDRRRLVAKAFGGGNVLAGIRTPTVGELNVKFVREFLETERIPLVGERLGGDRAVRVVFHTDSGKALLQSVDGSRLPKLIREETSWYNIGPAERFPSVEPVLF